MQMYTFGEVWYIASGAWLIGWILGATFMAFVSLKRIK